MTWVDCEICFHYLGVIQPSRGPLCYRENYIKLWAGSRGTGHTVQPVSCPRSMVVRGTYNLENFLSPLPLSIVPFMDTGMRQTVSAPSPDTILPVFNDFSLLSQNQEPWSLAAQSPFLPVATGVLSEGWWQSCVFSGNQDDDSQWMTVHLAGYLMPGPSVLSVRYQHKPTFLVLNS